MKRITISLELILIITSILLSSFPTTSVTARSKDESTPLITKEYTIPLLDMVIEEWGLHTGSWPQIPSGQRIVTTRIVDLEVHENELIMVISVGIESWNTVEGIRYSYTEYYTMMGSIRIDNLNNPLLNVIIPLVGNYRLFKTAYIPLSTGVGFFQDQLVVIMKTKKRGGKWEYDIGFYEEVSNDTGKEFQQIYNTTNDDIKNSVYLTISNHTACIFKELEQKFYQFNLSSIHYVSDNITTNFPYINGICYNENKLWCLGKDKMNSSLSLTYYDFENKKWTVFENKLPNSASFGLVVYNETLLTVASDDKGNNTKIIQILLENLLTVPSSNDYSGFWVCFDSFSFLIATIVLVLTMKKNQKNNK